MKKFFKVREKFESGKIGQYFKQKSGKIEII